MVCDYMMEYSEHAKLVLLSEVILILLFFSSPFFIRLLSINTLQFFLVALSFRLHKRSCESNESVFLREWNTISILNLNFYCILIALFLKWPRRSRAYFLWRSSILIFVLICYVCRLLVLINPSPEFIEYYHYIYLLDVILWVETSQVVFRVNSLPTQHGPRRTNSYERSIWIHLETRGAICW